MLSPKRGSITVDLGAIGHMHGQQDTQFIHLLRAEAAFGDNVEGFLRSAQHKNVGALSPGLIGGPGAKLKHFGAVFKTNSIRVDGEDAGDALDAAFISFSRGLGPEEYVIGGYQK